MNDKPSGLLVPLTTPFDSATGDVAPVHLRDNARALLDRGVDGLVACGSTGEASLLDDGEYRHIVDWLRDVVPPDRWLIAGAGRESTRATIAACKVAGAAGADAVLVRSPSYYAPVLTAASLSRHFRQVADESPLPVFLYNMPKYTHVSLTDTLLASIADHPNIWGIKDSSGDLKNFAAYRDAVPDWTLFMGSGALFYAALELGAAGAIAAAGCFAAELTVEIGEAFAAGDRERAGATQEKLAPLHREIVGGYGVAGVKTAVDAVGLAGGPVRSPLSDLSAGDRERVHELVRRAGLCTS
ncbi:MAG: dihydrodipicolinate synthase family protein [Gemmatimonadota bacterium]|nr:MAG: dihydrodipicolinate synthase family protein [Gemmatimonadota bacterium]